MTEPRRIGPIVREEADRLRGGISGIGQKKQRIYRDWSLAREHVEEQVYCAACGEPDYLEASHVIGREHDSHPPVRPVPGWKPFLVVPDRVIGLCNACHQGPQGIHAKRLDLLPLLDLHKQVQAVADAGGIARAYTILMPSESPKRMAA